MTARALGRLASTAVLAARDRGFDVSYPQCGSTLPAAADFGIVGVDGGRPFDVNACLAAQVAWAHQFGRPTASAATCTVHAGPISTSARWALRPGGGRWPSG